MTLNSNYLKAAVESVLACAPTFKKYFGRPEKVEKKHGNRLDLVTEVDKNIEKKIRAQIIKNFPTHSILGEENGLNDQHNKDHCLWIIDPIDGTTNYIQGVAECVISLGFWDKHGPAVGVIYNPITNQLFTAQRGKGAFLNGKKILASKTKNLKDAFTTVGWNESRDKSASDLLYKAKSFSRKIRVLGTSALQLAYVASGTADTFCVNGINAWDFAAGVLLITEAGGRATDWQGKPITLTTREIAASNKNLHKDLIKKLS